MKIKYKNKIYSSADVPLFIYFKTGLHRKHFTLQLTESSIDEFYHSNHIFAVIAGNTVIKDRRSKIYFSVDEDLEKTIILQNIINDGSEDNNAMISTPPDINEDIIYEWVNKHIDKIR